MRLFSEAPGIAGAKEIGGRCIEDGARVSAETSRRLACDASRVVMRHDEEGFQVARGPDGALRFRRPDGRPLPEVPAPAAVPGDPVETLRAHHDAHGLHIGARTACAGWLGEPLDVTWAIDVLHPLAQSVRPGILRTNLGTIQPGVPAMTPQR